MKKVATWLALVLIAGFGLQANPALGDDVYWTYLYYGIPGNYNDGAYSIIRGSDGNLYTAGYSASNGQGLQFTVISLTANGSQRWIYRLNGYNNIDDLAWAVVQGSDGNIYAAGLTDGVDPGMGKTAGGTLTVVSLNTNGQQRWVWRSKLPALTWKTGDLRSLAWGSDGNLYAAGYSFPGSTGSDITVISLTSSGKLRWVFTYDGGYGLNDVSDVKSITCGTDGNIYVTGWIGVSNVPPTTKMIILSLTSQGQLRANWPVTLGSAALDCGRSIIYGTDGNIYVGGTLGGQGGGMTVVSVSSNGYVNWTYSDPGYGDGHHLTRGSDGNLYLAGKKHNGNDMDYAVLSTTSSGSFRWLYRYNPGGQTSYDIATSITFSGGSVYSAGGALGDLAMISLTPEGSEKYVHFYSGLWPWEDIAWSLVCGPGTNDWAYAAGTSATSTDGWDYTVHAYQQLPGGTDGGTDWRSNRDVTNAPSGPGGIVGNENAGRHGGGFGLFPNSPNPFVRNTAVTYSIAKAENVTLKVFNSFGELVKTLMTGPESPGVHRVSWDGTDDSGRRVGAGVYFCRLVAGGTTASRTVVLSR